MDYIEQTRHTCRPVCFSQVKVLQGQVGCDQKPGPDMQLLRILSNHKFAAQMPNNVLYCKVIYFRGIDNCLGAAQSMVQVRWKALTLLF